MVVHGRASAGAKTINGLASAVSSRASKQACGREGQPYGGLKSTIKGPSVGSNEGGTQGQTRERCESNREATMVVRLGGSLGQMECQSRSGSLAA